MNEVINYCIQILRYLLSMSILSNSNAHYKYNIMSHARLSYVCNPTGVSLSISISLMLFPS